MLSPPSHVSRPPPAAVVPSAAVSPFSPFSSFCSSSSSSSGSPLSPSTKSDAHAAAASLSFRGLPSGGRSLLCDPLPPDPLPPKMSSPSFSSSSPSSSKFQDPVVISALDLHRHPQHPILGKIEGARRRKRREQVSSSLLSQPSRSRADELDVERRTRDLATTSLSKTGDTVLPAAGFDRSAFIGHETERFSLSEYEWRRTYLRFTKEEGPSNKIFFGAKRAGKSGAEERYMLETQPARPVAFTFGPGGYKAARKRIFPCFVHMWGVDSSGRMVDKLEQNPAYQVTCAIWDNQNSMMQRYIDLDIPKPAAEIMMLFDDVGADPLWLKSPMMKALTLVGRHNLLDQLHSIHKVTECPTVVRENHDETGIFNPGAPDATEAMYEHFMMNFFHDQGNGKQRWRDFLAQYCVNKGFVMVDWDTARSTSNDLNLSVHKVDPTIFPPAERPPGIIGSMEVRMECRRLCLIKAERELEKRTRRANHPDDSSDEEDEDASRSSRRTSKGGGGRKKKTTDKSKKEQQDEKKNKKRGQGAAGAEGGMVFSKEAMTMRTMSSAPAASPYAIPPSVPTGGAGAGMMTWPRGGGGVWDPRMSAHYQDYHRNVHAVGDSDRRLLLMELEETERGLQRRLKELERRHESVSPSTRRRAQTPSRSRSRSRSHNPTRSRSGSGGDRDRSGKRSNDGGKRASSVWAASRSARRRTTSDKSRKRSPYGSESRLSRARTRTRTRSRRQTPSRSAAGSPSRSRSRSKSTQQQPQEWERSLEYRKQTERDLFYPKHINYDEVRYKDYDDNTIDTNLDYSEDDFRIEPAGSRR